MMERKVAPGGPEEVVTKESVEPVTPPWDRDLPAVGSREKDGSEHPPIFTSLKFRSLPGYPENHPSLLGMTPAFKVTEADGVALRN